MSYDIRLSRYSSSNVVSFEDVFSIFRHYDPNCSCICWIYSKGSEIDVKFGSDTGLTAEECTLYLDKLGNFNSIFAHRATDLNWNNLAFDLMNKFGFIFSNGGKPKYVNTPVEEGIHDSWVKISNSSELDDDAKKEYIEYVLAHQPRHKKIEDKSINQELGLFKIAKWKELPFDIRIAIIGCFLILIVLLLPLFLT